MVRDMDSLPYPDYEEYFEELQASGIEPELQFPKRVMFETSLRMLVGRETTLHVLRLKRTDDDIPEQIRRPYAGRIAIRQR